MNRLALAVSGMSCTGCEARIAAALARLDGVDHAEADHRAGTVVVDYDAATVDEATITRRLADAGYQTLASGAGR
ncbi:MAG: heavy-metal-associated domain-containing protein [Actinomycetota bacterium]|nr:heavy-metal-associated domain-containing protein [Actinomycetota bacterium]MDQ3642054.1 heavy-metal-associated domain-containing protein [Actinomycetota bacterium]